MHTLSLPCIAKITSSSGNESLYHFMFRTENYLKQKLHLSQDAKFEPHHEPSIIKQAGFYFMTIAGVIKHGLGSYLFSLNLFSIIKQLSTLLLHMLTFSYSLLDAFFFLAFEINLLKNNLNIRPEEQDLLLEQTHILGRLIIISSDIAVLRHLNESDYLQLHQLNRVFIHHLQQQHLTLQHRLNTPGMKILSYSLIGLGSFSKLSSNYFFCQTFLNSFFPQLIGTMSGWLFTDAIVISSLGLYFSINGAGIYQYMHGETKTLAYLEKELPKLQTKISQQECNLQSNLSLFRALNDRDFIKSPALNI